MPEATAAQLIPAVIADKYREGKAISRQKS
jgi:hypothetical protein